MANKKNDTYILFVFACIFAVCICLVLPIFNIVYGGVYYDTISCNTYDCYVNSNDTTPITVGDTTFINMDKWLIVNGVMMIVYFVLMISLYFVRNTESESKKVLIFVSSSYTIVFLFEFIWLVVGSVLLWRDCVVVSERDVNALMHGTLVLQYIALALTLLYFLTPTKDKDDEKDE
jgi:hypothetical protein